MEKTIAMVWLFAIVIYAPVWSTEPLKHDAKTEDTTGLTSILRPLHYGSWISKEMAPTKLLLNIGFSNHSIHGAPGEFFYSPEKDLPFFSQEPFVLSNSPMYAQHAPLLYQPSSFGSCMRFSAHYDRAQCYISLGKKDSFFSFLSGSFEPSTVSTGIGFRYQWSDALAFELGTTFFLPNQTGKKESAKIEAISDFSEQVSTLSKPLKTTFAEGFIRVVISLFSK